MEKDTKIKIKRVAATVGGIAVAIAAFNPVTIGGAIATGAVGLFVGNSWANLVDKTRLSYYEKKAH